MFLTQRVKSESGSSLLAVVGIMAVILIVGAVITAVTINAMGFTSSTRAGVQSSSAAQAGVDAVVARVARNACPTTAVLSGTDPQFTATVYSSASSSQPTSWPTTPGCPTSGTKWIRVVSTGVAAAKGVAGNSALDTQKVEAVYPYAGVVSPTSTGSTVYTYNAGNFSGPKVMKSADGTPADIAIANGNFLCDTGAPRVEGSVLVSNGSAGLENGCTITKNVVAKVSIDAARGHIDGNATSKGSVWPSTSGGAIKGAITSGPSAVVPAAKPWVDYAFVPLQWQERGYQVVPWSGSCAVDNTVEKQAFIKGIAASGVPTVINATGVCTSLINGTYVDISNSAALSLVLKADIAIIANGFNIGELTVSTDGPPRQLRFITPDNSINGSPDCSASMGKVDVNNRSTINPGVSAFIYSPCLITFSSASWRGQLYGQRVDLNPNSEITAAPIGFVDIDIDTGSPLPTGGTLGTRIYLRDFNG